jgi:sorbitol-specific phosphotransferase system component IIA
MSDPSIASELDNLRFDAVAEYADLAASYWRSAAEAAFRGDRTTLEVHCKQLAAVTREAFKTVKELGTGVAP